jgi:hypothetical protein
MPDQFLHQQLIPQPQPEILEILASHQVSYDFHQEVQYREALEAHCQWYYKTAAQNQRDLAVMRQELNIWGLLFHRG